MRVSGGVLHFLADFGVCHAEFLAVEPVLQAEIAAGKGGKDDADGGDDL